MTKAKACKLRVLVLSPRHTELQKSFQSEIDETLIPRGFIDADLCVYTAIYSWH